LKDLEEEIFHLVNQYRISLELKALKPHSFLAEMAKKHCQDMVDEKIQFGHGGYSKRSALMQHKLKALFCGENLAFNHAKNPCTRALEQWLNSEGHRANIEKGVFSHTGISVIQKEDGNFYFTQLFASLDRPKNRLITNPYL